ncbi:hypothetical protein V2G26_015682 [Clonostachys chloroleuca]
MMGLSQPKFQIPFPSLVAGLPAKTRPRQGTGRLGQGPHQCHHGRTICRYGVQAMWLCSSLSPPLHLAHLSRPHQRCQHPPVGVVARGYPFENPDFFWASGARDANLRTKHKE